MAQAGRNPILQAGRLIAVAAHDLKNPVSGIMSAAEYLIEDAAGLLESEHLAMLQSIESSSRQMLAIIEDLSEIGAIESEKPQFDASPKDLVQLVRSAVEESRPAAGLKKIRIDLRADSHPLLAEVDPARMQMGLQRLLGLGISAVPRGARIGIRIRRVKENAVIRVGIGGAAGESGARPRDPRGALSVLLVERIAEAHGGALECASEAGGGQWFQLLLPLSGRAHSGRSCLIAGREPSPQR
jgi:signal transduction histidine kinase